MAFSDAVFDRYAHAVLRVAENRKLEDTLQVIMIEALELLDAQSGYIAFLDEEGELEYHVRRDRQGNMIKPVDSKTNQLIHKEVLQPRVMWAQRENGLRMAAPLEVHGRLLGVLILNDCRAEEQPENLLRNFSNIAALAIDNARQNEKLETVAGENRVAHGRLKQEMERLSIIDSLTGIANHRHFYELGEQIFNRSNHPPYELVALMLDLDRFGRINDQYGHVTGDAVLQIVVNRLLQGLRPSDLIGRYEGEKFAVLLPRTTSADACTVAERLRIAIETNMIEVGFDNIPLTISVGIAGLTAKVHSLADLLKQADQALIIAKQRSGNRWVVWQP